MKYLDIDIKDLKLRGGYDTAKEISHQPQMWQKTFDRVREEKDQIGKFIANVVDKSNPCVILTGAGTSAFIGEVLAGTVQKQLKISAKSIPTTDIITHAAD
jgi:tagatose-6-phosphate ketose/aldose isomerase